MCVCVKEADVVEVNLLSWRESDYKNVLYPLLRMSKWSLLSGCFLATGLNTSPLVSPRSASSSLPGLR